MSGVNEPEFNCIFISHAHEDKDFAQKFQEKLQGKLGDSKHVWIDDYLLEGKEWRREIQRRLNSTALVVVILSPDSIKSPWVLYEWHCSLLLQQSEPFLVHFRKCSNNDLKRFTDYQIPDPFIERDELMKDLWMNKETEINDTLDAIAKRLQGFSKLKEYYETLTYRHGKTEDQRDAADELGKVPEGLKLAAANYLIEALQFWLSHDNMYGYVGASIASSLGRLGKRKAIPVLVKLFVEQSGQSNVLSSVERALNHLSFEDSV